MAKLESPMRFGNGGKVPGGPAPAGGKLVSPNKATKGSETSGHDNGVKK